MFRSQETVKEDTFFCPIAVSDDPNCVRLWVSKSRCGAEYTKNAILLTLGHWCGQWELFSMERYFEAARAGRCRTGTHKSDMCVVSRGHAERKGCVEAAMFSATALIPTMQKKN